jgi:hypothetical protein
MNEAPEKTGSPLLSLWRRLGPGLVTGAADDDPSEIGTHSQIGAQFGFGLSWTFLFSFPSARTAVVLGEQSLATRRVRATDLLENGFKRYFWKSLFGTSIDGLAIQQASLTDGPPHLKDARRRQTQAVRYAQGHSQGQSQGRLEEAQHCQHRRQLSGMSALGH